MFELRPAILRRSSLFKAWVLTRYRFPFTYALHNHITFKFRKRQHGIPNQLPCRSIVHHAYIQHMDGDSFIKQGLYQFNALRALLAILSSFVTFKVSPGYMTTRSLSSSRRRDFVPVKVSAYTSAAPAALSAFSCASRLFPSFACPLVLTLA